MLSPVKPAYFDLIHAIETHASHSDDSKPIPHSEPLAPPPRPAPANPAETPDYFSVSHNGSTEFNPFEQSFGVPSSETPGKSLLPSVAALASPAIPGNGSTPGFGWGNSLRSGPLSPAMLTGPAGSNAGDYFDSINRSFPTPNESSLRTGLTPGGGGSMFPAPSPGSSALFHQLQSGTATPGTLDFHRTAMNAAARSKTTSYAQTSQPQDSHQNGMEAHHDATDAANGLFMLAKGGQGNNQFTAPHQPQQSHQNNGMQNGKRSTRNNNGSLASLSGPDMDGNGESPESEEQNSRPATRGGRGKKTTKAEAAANNRRKADPAPKGANKRAKGNNGAANLDPSLEPGDDDDDEMMDSGDDGPQDKKGQTDEEKRRNFLERNRYVFVRWSPLLLANNAIGLLHLNADSARSNGSRISRPRSRCTRKRMTSSAQQSRHCMKRSANCAPY